MKALADHHDDDGTGAYGAVGSSGKSIAGRFFARLWDLDCVLELHLDNAGLLKGSFIVDGEQLEITGALLGPHGEVRGIIRAHNLAEAFAAFQARLAEDGLFLEVNVTDADTGLETARRVIFVRLG
jgi:hypothetical protein